MYFSFLSPGSKRVFGTIVEKNVSKRPKHSELFFFSATFPLSPSSTFHCPFLVSFIPPHPNISIHIPHTLCYAFSLILTWRIRFIIEDYKVCDHFRHFMTEMNESAILL